MVCVCVSNERMGSLGAKAKEQWKFPKYSTNLAARKQLHTQVDIPTASFMASCPINNSHSHPAEEKDVRSSWEWSGLIDQRMPHR